MLVAGCNQPNGGELVINPLQHRILKSLSTNPSTAQSIGSELGVDESTISRNLRFLLECGIVIVKDYLPASSSGGRKSRLLSLNSEWLKIIGLSIEQGEICLVRVDFTARQYSAQKKTVNVSSENFERILCEIINANKDSHAVSIAVPGLIDSSKGQIIFSQALCLRDCSVNRLTGMPSMILNDANAAAACYLNDARNIVYFLFTIPYDLSKPVGLGAGIVINGSLYEGSNNSAGELGEGVPLTGLQGLTIEDLERNRKVLLRDQETLDEFKQHISFKIATAVNFVDPELFILGGDFYLLDNTIIQDIINRVEKQVTLRRIKKINWELDKNGSKTVAFGSVIAFLKRFFNDLDFANFVIQNRGC